MEAGSSNLPTPTKSILRRADGPRSYALPITAAAIVHLIGFPAAGKLTVARALADESARHGERCVVLDNHHTNNVIFAALDIDGVKPVPQDVWDRIREVRELLLRTIEDLSPRDWTFVFTNVLTDDKASERATVDRLVKVAERTDRAYLPVLLQCDVDTLTARVDSQQRRDRSKWVDPPAVGDYVRTHQLVDVADLHPLTIDTGTIAPAEAALLILRRLND